MFLVRIRLGGRKYLGVLDTGAPISIVPKKPLPPEDLKNIMPTVAIRMRDSHVVHSCGDCEVDMSLGTRGMVHWFVIDSEAVNFVLRTNVFAEHPQIPSLTLQEPYVLHVDHGDGRESIPLEQSQQAASYLGVCIEEPSAMMVASEMAD